MAYDYINEGSIDASAVAKGIRGNKKARVLELLKLLNEETDQEHPLSTNEIIARMSELGLSVNRKTVKDDIDLLIAFGYDVVVIKSTNNSFYMGDRIFELSDLKMLVDAVSASKVVSSRSTNALIERLQKLCSKYQAEELVWNKDINKTIKPYSKNINLTIDKLAKAISKKMQVGFKYNVYNTSKQTYHKHDGRVYVISPYFMIWSEDHYYLVGFDEAASKIKTFRIDRIDGATLLVLKLQARRPDKDLFRNYSRGAFGMMTDESRRHRVELQCDNSIVTSMIDRFGQEVDIRKVDDEHFRMSIEVYASPSFYGWLVNFGDRIRVINPPSVAAEYKEHLEKILKNYK